MSEEPFWEPVQDWWSNAKIRLSAGQLANQMTGYYDYIQSVDADGMFTQQITLDGVSVLSYATEADPNAGTLTWEKMTTYDAGIDMAWLNNRLSLTGDIYMRNTEGMLNTGTALPAVYGATDPKQNSANMSTKGWELSLAWRDQHNVLGKPLRYEISGGVGNYKTVITKYNNPEKLLSTYYEGMVLGEIWGYEIDGLFASQAEVDDYMSRVNVAESDGYVDIVKEVNAAAPGLHPGDVRYVDLNGDGKITPGTSTVDDPGDRRIIGNTLPQYNYNFHLSAEWYGVDLSLYFQGVGKRDWYPSGESPFWGQYNRPYNQALTWMIGNYWTKDNPTAYLPKYTGYYHPFFYGIANSRYLQDASYIRLQNLQVGWNLPKKWLEKIRLSAVSIYFSGENLWTWSPMYKRTKDFDVVTVTQKSDNDINTDNWGDGFNYPTMRTYSIGITITY